MSYLTKNQAINLRAGGGEPDPLPGIITGIEPDPIPGFSPEPDPLPGYQSRDWSYERCKYLIFTLKIFRR